MLAKIKSNFILEQLLSLISEKGKLKLVKYNKTLKKKLDMSLINQKLFTKEFIIYETNTNVKIYNAYYNNKLIFEGEFLNDK